MGARWEVAPPLTMVSAARWENWVRAATRAEASGQRRARDLVTATRVSPGRRLTAGGLPNKPEAGTRARLRGGGARPRS